ncbi:hypothetical protein HPB47_009614 [Ixodes persulcatus]|uniref:Uncharacterized protein n=1 Tax=Ixodes persulcatus TaxID=34615 RepID=A0AC60P1L2_IXOPE|nr:hypothetical protein HPB47_009614 [Ixodes persulcatus]
MDPKQDLPNEFMQLNPLADKVLEVASPTVSSILASPQTQQATTSFRQWKVLQPRPRKRTAAVEVKPGTARSGGGELGGQVSGDRRLKSQTV